MKSLQFSFEIFQSFSISGFDTWRVTFNSLLRSSPFALAPLTLRPDILYGLQFSSEILSTPKEPGNSGGWYLQFSSEILGQWVMWRGILSTRQMPSILLWDLPNTKPNSNNSPGGGDDLQFSFEIFGATSCPLHRSCGGSFNSPLRSSKMSLMLSLLLRLSTFNSPLRSSKVHIEEAFIYPPFTFLQFSFEIFDEIFKANAAILNSPSILLWDLPYPHMNGIAMFTGCWSSLQFSFEIFCWYLCWLG